VQYQAEVLPKPSDVAFVQPRWWFATIPIQTKMHQWPRVRPEFMNPT